MMELIFLNQKESRRKQMITMTTLYDSRDNYRNGSPFLSKDRNYTPTTPSVSQQIKHVTPAVVVIEQR